MAAGWGCAAERTVREPYRGTARSVYCAVMYSPRREMERLADRESGEPQRVSTAVVCGGNSKGGVFGRRTFLLRSLGLGVIAGLPLALTGCGSGAKGFGSNGTLSGLWPWGAPRTTEQTLTGYTCIQCDGPYLPGWDWQTDIVLAYFDNATVDYESQYQSWQGHGYRVGTMMAATHDWQGTYTRGLYDGQTHYELVQTNWDGSYVEDSGGAYWMAPIPEGEWVAYLLAMCKRAIDAGSRLIVFDEPMYAFTAGYETPFKTAWQQVYGEPWQPQTASTQALWDTCQLKAQLWVETFAQIADWIHQYNADVKVYPAPHAILDFAYWSIIFPHAAVLEKTNVDGLFYEVWGTFSTPTFQQHEVLRWERAYAEYAMSGGLSFQSGKGMKAMAQTAGADAHQYPIGDMACALMIPWLDSFEVGPAYRPGFTTPGPGLGHDRIMNMARLYEGIPVAQNLTGLDSGCSGLGVAVSDSLMYQNAQASGGVRSWEGMFFPLTMRGLLPSCPALEAFGRTGYSSGLGLRCLLLEYEDQVPGSEQINADLAGWVRQGGVLIVVGGHSAWNSVAGWWQKAGFSRPQDHLFSLMGMVATGGTPSAGRVWQPAGNNWAKGLGFTAAMEATAPFPVVGYDAVNGANPLFTSGGKIVAFEGTYGKGKVFFFGCSPSYFTGTSQGAALAESLVAAVYEQVSLGPFEAQGHWGIDRGPVVMRRVTSGSVQLKGLYLRLSDGTIPLEVDPVAQATPEPHVFLRVPWSTVSVPTILFSNLRLSAVSASHAETVFTGASQQGAPGSTRIWAPGRKVASVTAVAGHGPLSAKPQPAWEQAALGITQTWDAPSESLLLQFAARPEGVTVRVSWQ